MKSTKADNIGDKARAVLRDMRESGPFSDVSSLAGMKACLFDFQKIASGKDLEEIDDFIDRTSKVENIEDGVFLALQFAAYLHRISLPSGKGRAPHEVWRFIFKIRSESPGQLVRYIVFTGIQEYEKARRKKCPYDSDYISKNYSKMLKKWGSKF